MKNCTKTCPERALKCVEFLEQVFQPPIERYGNGIVIENFLERRLLMSSIKLFLQ